MAHPTHKSLAVAGLLLNALVWGLCWWPFKQLESLGLHPLWATALVYGFVFLSIGLWLGLRGSLLSWRQHPALWLLLLASGLTNVGFNWAVTVGDVVRVVLLFYLMPAWSVLLAWWWLGERPNRMALLRLALALAGVALVLKTPEMDWPWPSSMLDYLALMGGASFALNNVMLRKMAHTPEAYRMSAMFAGGTLVTALVAMSGSSVGWMDWPPATDWWPYAVVLGLCLLLSNLSLQYGAARLPAATTSLVMLSEIVFASLSSVALGASELTDRKLLGGALIVLAAVLATMPDRSKETPT
jgi:drug/metabolite transporter (DMT)-like permease